MNNSNSIREEAKTTTTAATTQSQPQPSQPKPKKKRGGKWVKLLKQRRLYLDLLKIEGAAVEHRQHFIERLADLKKQLSTKAK
ncbi:hypothetical protein ACLKA7_008663 [Drosophila subpalustris]